MICEPAVADRQTDRDADCNTSHPSREEASNNETRHRASTELLLTFRVRTMFSYREVEASLLVGWLVGWMDGWMVSWLEFNVTFQHNYGYIRDEVKLVTTVRVILL